MSDLKISIEAFYQSFSDLSKPTTINGCPCCVERKNLCTLLAKPLRVLSPDDLGPYAHSAFLTVGDTADYLYFLPRILEISITEDGWWPDPEITGRAIAETHPDCWPENRRIALEQLLVSVIRSLLEKPDTDTEIDGWMCAIAQTGLEVTPYLELLEASPVHVIDYYEHNARSLMKGKLTNAFWEKPCTGYDKILEWFRCSRVSHLIAKAYDLSQ